MNKIIILACVVFAVAADSSYGGGNFGGNFGGQIRGGHQGGGHHVGGHQGGGFNGGFIGGQQGGYGGGAGNAEIIRAILLHKSLGEYADISDFAGLGGGDDFGHGGQSFGGGFGGGNQGGYGKK